MSLHQELTAERRVF